MMSRGALNAGWNAVSPPKVTLTWHLLVRLGE